MAVKKTSKKKPSKDFSVPLKFSFYLHLFEINYGAFELVYGVTTDNTSKVKAEAALKAFLAKKEKPPGKKAARQIGDFRLEGVTHYKCISLRKITKGPVAFAFE